MTKKAKRIMIAIVSFVLIALTIWGIILFRNTKKILSRDYGEDVYIDVPNSELTLVVKQWSYLGNGGVEFYYVKERF